MTTQDSSIRHNGLTLSSLDAFAHVRGSVNQGRKDVYFLRAVGMCADYLTQIAQLDSLFHQQMSTGQLRCRRIHHLPRLVSVEDAAYYASCYDQWHRRGRTALTTRVTQGQPDLCRAASRACMQTAALFRQCSTGANDSQERNFVAKLLYWFDQLCGGLLEDWSAQTVVKLVLHSVVKRQEYLFCCFLTFLGIDVLLLQFDGDIDPSLDALGLSQTLVLGRFGSCHLPPFSPSPHRASVPTPHTLPVVTNTRRPDRDKRSASPPAQSSTPRRSAPPRQELDYEQLAQLASSVVMISIHNHSGEIIGTGSGIMIGRDGYILTNNHVASGGQFYSVRIEDDNNIYTTDELVKYNGVLDLALIRIRRTLTPIPLYQEAKPLARGQKVVAIGSPLGLFNSVSNGIISGFRKINEVDMIQFTAPISPGSSGGAVLNLFGEVIGISTAGIDSGQNINLAVGYQEIALFTRGFR